MTPSNVGEKISRLGGTRPAFDFLWADHPGCCCRRRIWTFLPLRRVNWFRASSLFYVCCRSCGQRNNKEK